jgi:uncharacterized membrane protein YccF (DUF307 family)
MRLLGNLVWFVFGGLALAIGYALAGVVMLVLIVTIPFALQSFKLAGFALWPFGRQLVRRPEAGAASLLGNVLWLLLAGWWIALGHLTAAVLSAITVIGIPFAIAHLKLARTALWPMGYDVAPVTAAPPGAVVVAPR